MAEQNPEEQNIFKMMPRARSATRGRRVSRTAKKKELSPQETHVRILNAVQTMNKTTDVFHLRWVPGELIDADVLHSTPVFWYLKFAWSREDIMMLFSAASAELTRSMQDELDHVYGVDGQTVVNRGRRKESIAYQPPFLRSKRKVWKPQMRALSSKPNTPNFTGLPGIDDEKSQSSGMSTLLEMNGHMVDLQLSDVDSSREPSPESSTASRSMTSSPRRKRHRKGSSQTFQLLQRRSLIDRAELLWIKLIEERGTDTLNEAQLNIELQNRDILVDPDVSHIIFVLIKGDTPGKTFGKNDLARCLTHAENADLDGVDYMGDLTKLPDDLRNFVVFKKICEHILSGQPLDVNDLLTPKLDPEDYEDCQVLLDHISSRQTEWRIRLDILEYLEPKLLEARYHALVEKENIGNFLMAWATQCLDDRTNLSKVALELFPSVFYTAMGENTQYAFTHLNDIITTLFLALRNTRSVHLQKWVDKCFQKIMVMIQEWHREGDLDDEVMLEALEILANSIESQKHDRIRERCTNYLSILVFGLADLQGLTEETADPEQTPAEMIEWEKGYLLNDENFSPLIARGINSAAVDKAENARKEAFRMMKKAEEGFPEFMASLNRDAKDRYNKFKERLAKRNSRTRRNSARSRLRPRRNMESRASS